MTAGHVMIDSVAPRFSHSDHGRVVVLDPRLITARYGRVFLDALPPGVEVKTLTDQFEG
jgi:Rad3-related DNA helicase